MFLIALFLIFFPYFTGEFTLLLIWQKKQANLGAIWGNNYIDNTGQEMKKKVSLEWSTNQRPFVSEQSLQVARVFAVRFGEIKGKGTQLARTVQKIKEPSWS